MKIMIMISYDDKSKLPNKLTVRKLTSNMFEQAEKST